MYHLDWARLVPRAVRHFPHLRFMRAIALAIMPLPAPSGIKA